MVTQRQYYWIFYGENTGIILFKYFKITRNFSPFISKKFIILQHIKYNIIHLSLNLHKHDNHKRFSKKNRIDA